MPRLPRKSSRAYHGLRENDDRGLDHPIRWPASRPDNRNPKCKDRWGAVCEICNLQSFDFEDDAGEYIHSRSRFCADGGRESPENSLAFADSPARREIGDWPPIMKTRGQKRSRIDNLLVARGFFESRERAQRAIMANEVRVGDRTVTKSSELVAVDAPISIARPQQFVSRGAVKLAGALDFFDLDVREKIALDIGASTGGFTDCLLQRGAAKVYAVDVGHGQLAWKIRNDSRVIVLEKLNARFLSREQIPEPVDLCVIDVSFISLILILPNAFQLLTPNGVILALVKPQFELQRADVGRGGIVRDPALHEKAQQKIVNFVESSSHRVVGLVPSALTGTDGNQEFFICVRKRSA